VKVAIYGGEGGIPSAKVQPFEIIHWDPIDKDSLTLVPHDFGRVLIRLFKSPPNNFYSQRSNLIAKTTGDRSSQA